MNRLIVVKSGMRIDRAMGHVFNGYFIRRHSWSDDSAFGLVLDGLKRNSTNEFKLWFHVLSAEDVMTEDWVVVSPCMRLDKAMTFFFNGDRIRREFWEEHDAFRVAKGSDGKPVVVRSRNVGEPSTGWRLSGPDMLADDWVAVPT